MAAIDADTLTVHPRLRYEFETSAVKEEEGFEESEYSVEITAKIIAEIDRETAGPPLPILELGEITFWKLHVENALNDGYGLIRVFDVSDTLLHAGTALFDYTHDRYHAPIRRELGREAGDILYIDRLVIDPMARGQKLGLTVLDRVMRDWSRGFDFVLMKPFPLQYEAAAKRDPKLLAEVSTEKFAQTEKTAFAHLRRYYEQLGFKRFPRTEFHGIEPHEYLDHIARVEFAKRVELPVAAVAKRFGVAPTDLIPASKAFSVAAYLPTPENIATESETSALTA